MVLGAPKREARSMAPRRVSGPPWRGSDPVPFCPSRASPRAGAPEPPRAAPQPGTAPPAHTADLGPERAARSITRAHARPVHGRASAPPVIAIPTPVVLGKVIGSFLRLRTARYANACASRYADDQPTASAVTTSARTCRLSRSSNSLLFAPPPATIHRAGGSAKKSSARAAARAVKAASV